MEDWKSHIFYELTTEIKYNQIGMTDQCVLQFSTNIFSCHDQGKSETKVLPFLSKSLALDLEKLNVS